MTPPPPALSLLKITSLSFCLKQAIAGKMHKKPLPYGFINNQAFFYTRQKTQHKISKRTQGFGKTQAKNSKMYLIFERTSSIFEKERTLQETLLAIGFKFSCQKKSLK